MSPLQNINFKCESLNVRGLNKSIKRRSIFRWLHNQNNHLTFLQETYSSKDCTKTWEAEWGGKVFFSHGTSHSKGVMILVNPKVDFKIEKAISDNNGRYIILDAMVDDSHVVLVNIYAPNDLNQQLAFFNDLQHILQEFAQEHIIIGGDFNCALHDKDKKGGNPVSKKILVIKKIEEIMNLYNLFDIWRKPTNENKILDYGFTKENIHDVYLLPFSVTKETKLIAFQYKIIHNILPCRSSLFRAGLVDDDICPLCKLEKQTLVHMLYNCSESLHFWETFTQWWEQIFFETIFLSADVILFGWHQNANNKRVLNYILIIAKYHIFTTSVCDDRLSFDCFLLRLKSKLDILRTIAIKNKSLNKFETTWAPFL